MRGRFPWTASPAAFFQSRYGNGCNSTAMRQIVKQTTIKRRGARPVGRHRVVPLVEGEQRHWFVPPWSSGRHAMVDDPRIAALVKLGQVKRLISPPGSPGAGPRVEATTSRVAGSKRRRTTVPACGLPQPMLRAGTPL